MDIGSWIILWIFEVLFLSLAIRHANWLEGSFFAAFVSIFAVRWNAEGIKLFCWISLIATTIWFVAGLAVPGLRF